MTGGPEDGGGWAAVSDRLVRGLAHLLSNRANAILAVSGALDEGAQGAMVALLREEAEKLEEAVRLLRLVPRAEHHVPEALRIQDLLADVVALHQQRADAGPAAPQLAVADDAPPVRVDPSRAARALLLALDAVGRLDATGGVRIEADRAGAALHLAVRPATDGGGGAVSDAVADGVAAAAASAAALLRADDGVVSYDERRIDLRLPALGGGST